MCEENPSIGGRPMLRTTYVFICVMSMWSVVRGPWWVVPVAVFTTLTDLSRGQLRSLCRGAGPATTVVIHGQASQQAATAPAGRTKKPKCKPRITSHTVRLPVLGFTPCCALRLPVVTADMTATRQPHLGHLFQWRPWRTIKHQHLALQTGSDGQPWHREVSTTSCLSPRRRMWRTFRPLGLRHAKLVNGLCWGKLFTCFQRFNWDKFINCLIPKMLGSISLPVWINC